MAAAQLVQRFDWCPISGPTAAHSLLVFDAEASVPLFEDSPDTAGRPFFAPGNALALFRVGGVDCTAILCHERRYPELVRLPVMLGVLSTRTPVRPLAVLPTKDATASPSAREIRFTTFANRRPQGDGLWSAGDRKCRATHSRS